MNLSSHRQKLAMIQQVVVIISVIFALGSTNRWCGTYKQTGSCPVGENWYYAYVNDTYKLFLEQGSWILAAASSNAKDAPPPSKTCVTITVNETGKFSECIFNTFNHTPHLAKRVRIVGFDEDEELQVYSYGAIHHWPLEEQHRHYYDDYFFGKDYLHMNSMIKSTTCWDPHTLKFDPYRFIITNPFYGLMTQNTPHRAQLLLLIGVNARSPMPEIHLGLLADRKPDYAEIQYAIRILQVEKRNAWYFTRGYPEYMPPLKFRCAYGYSPSG